MLQVATRLYYNIDGRYDWHQLINEPELYLKTPYAIALFSPLVLGFLCYSTVELKGRIAGNGFSWTALLQLVTAAVLKCMEMYEVFIKSN